MAYTPEQVIEIARISQYLAANDVANGKLFGARKIPISPRTIYMERKALEWLYDLDPTNENITLISNYVFSLLRGYGLQAANIAGTGGGTITPIDTDGYSYVKRNYPITSDSTTFYHVNLVEATDLSIYLDNQPLLIQDVDYSFNSTTGIITGITFQFFTGSVLTATFNKKY